MRRSNKRCNKASMADALRTSHVDLSLNKVRDVVDAVFDIIKETLVRGEGVKLSGFGRFSLHDKHERSGRDPVRNTRIVIPARRVVRFKVSPTLRDRLNAHRTE